MENRTQQHQQSVTSQSFGTQFSARLRRLWRRLFLRGDLIALVLALGIMALPAMAVRDAAWTEGLSQLMPVAMLSVIFGFMLARSHYDELLSLIISSIYCLGFVGFFTVLNMEGGGSVTQRIGLLTQSMVDWVGVWVGQGVSQDPIIFDVFLSILFWFLGHNTAWHIFRIDRVWRSVLPAGTVLVVNIAYYTGSAPMMVYLAIYIVLALLLLVRSHIDAQEWEWYLQRAVYPARLRNQLMIWGAVLAIVLVGAAWMLPNGAQSENLNAIQELLEGDPLEDLNRLFNRLFASLDNEGQATADYYGGNSLQLGGSVQLGDSPVMLVDVPPITSAGIRYYWRSRTFAHYDGGRWTPTASVRLRVPESGYAITNPASLPGSRQDVQQQVTMILDSSRLVYAAGQPSITNLPVSIDLSWVDDSQSQMDVSVIRPLAAQRTGDEYSVSSDVFVADATALRTASTDYPAWVANDYLQIGNGVTQRTRDLAWQIVGEANAITPYDQAKVIESWLRRTIVYDETIPGAPPGADPVDWVLFEDQRGYCNYYASAMILMLRAVGVPARMAAGFAQGEWDNASQGYLVRERDAHTWVEVYFPGYGWIEFEPTAAQSQLDRAEPIPIAPDQWAQPTPTPFATNTPQMPPTPTATPTPSMTPTAIAQEGIAPVIPPTLTPAITITPTPQVLPTYVGPMDQQVERPGILQMLLSVLLGILVVLLVVIALVLIGLFLFWWVEWRGLGGLSPARRAYALLERYAGFLNIDLADTFTPHERRRILSDQMPESTGATRTITEMYVEETYGPDRPRTKRWNRLIRRALADVRKVFMRERFLRWLPWRRRSRKKGRRR